MNDEIDKINEINNAYRKDHDTTSPGDQSGWRNSKITTNEEDNKRSMAEGIIQDLANQRNDIDQIKAGLGQLAQMIEQQTHALNNLAQGVPVTQTQQQAKESPKMNMDSMLALGDVAEKLVSAYKNLKGNDNNVTPLISQEYLNEKMRNSVMENFELGETILGAVKDTLKKKAVKQIVTEALPKGGFVVDDHSPQ